MSHKLEVLAGIDTINKDIVIFKDKTTMRVRDKNLKDLWYTGVYDTITGFKDKTNPLQGYIEVGLDKLKKKIDNPNTAAISIKTLGNLISETQNYLDSNKTSETDYIEFLLSKQLFPWQKPILTDTSKKITLLCGRRAGKSYIDAALAVKHCAGIDTINGFTKTRNVLILGLTISKCAEVFWNNIIKFAEKSTLKFKANNSNYTIEFSNGNIIQLSGNSNRSEREKLRGTEWSLIIIDEAQSQNSLNYLMDDILGPIITGRNSSVVLSGTGALTNRGFWKDITSGDLCSKYTHYTATMRDNPSIPEGALSEVLANNNWDEDNVTYRREYLAENVVDTTRLVYPIRHYYDSIPIIDQCVIGVDYGDRDYNAFVPILYSKNKGYIYNPIKFNRSDVNTIITEGKKLITKIQEEFKLTNNQILCVADTSHQAISRELQRAGIRISNAYKVDRLQQIKDVRGLFERGDLLLTRNDLVDYDCDATVWKFDSENKSIVYEVDDDYYHSDILPALRYAAHFTLAKSIR